MENGVFITKQGKINFVDLAGSEMTKKTQSEGKTLEEANNINKSLMVLGKSELIICNYFFLLLYSSFSILFFYSLFSSFLLYFISTFIVCSIKIVVVTILFTRFIFLYMKIDSLLNTK